MKILYLTNVPAPYRVEYFNQLAKKCELTVLYEKNASDERDKKWVAKADSSYTSIFLQGMQTDDDKALSFQVLRHLNKTYDYILICGVATPTAILAILWCQLRRIPYCIEGDGASVKPCGGFKKILKQRLLAPAKLCFSTGKYHDEYYSMYGVDRRKIVRYHFSSVLESDIADQGLLGKKNEFKAKLGMSEKVVVLAVGQFIHRKGFDTLIRAAGSISKEVGIHFVGGVPTDEYKKLAAEKGLHNIHFEGFKTKEMLDEYYHAADIFVLPTREDIWGLVVEEAMAKGLPIVTTYQCASGVELVEPEQNGFLVNADDEAALAEAINKLIDDPELRLQAGIRSLEKVREYTIESMVDSHMKVFLTER